MISRSLGLSDSKRPLSAAITSSLSLRARSRARPSRMASSSCSSRNGFVRKLLAPSLIGCTYHPAGPVASETEPNGLKQLLITERLGKEFDGAILHSLH